MSMRIQHQQQSFDDLRCAITAVSRPIPVAAPIMKIVFPFNARNSSGSNLYVVMTEVVVQESLIRTKCIRSQSSRRGNRPLDYVGKLHDL